MSASIYRSITLQLNLFLERNNQAPVHDITYESIEDSVLAVFDKNYKNIGHRKYLLTVQHISDDNLDKKIEELLDNIDAKACSRDCNIGNSYIHVVGDENRRWE